jgi:hypothetical protein
MLESLQMSRQISEADLQVTTNQTVIRLPRQVMVMDLPPGLTGFLDNSVNNEHRWYHHSWHCLPLRLVGEQASQVHGPIMDNQHLVSTLIPTNYLGARAARLKAAGRNKKSKMHRRSSNLAQGVIPVPKLSKCPFKSLNLLIISQEVQITVV